VQESARLEGETMAAVIVCCRFLLIGVFAVSAAGKLHSPAAFRSFARSLRYLRLAPTGWSTPLAAVTAAVEVAVVVLLCLPATVAPGFAVAAALLVVLTAGIGWSLSRGVSAPCRCFGASRTPIGGAHLGRNGVLLLAALCGGVLVQFGQSRPQPADVVIGVLAAAVGLLGVLFLDDLMSLFAGPIRPAGRRPSTTSTRQGVSS
jgi:hypothetical protein